VVQVKRHIAKTISYRIISTAFGFLLMWALTDSIKIGATFSIVELMIKPAIYFLHERTWYKWIKFGLKK
jgi:uncharacterized membrane protein